MKKILYTLLISCSFLALSACSSGTIATRNNNVQLEKYIVATVNGQAITENAIKTLKTETAMYNKRIDATREQLIKELINRELLYQQAVKHQLDQKPEIMAQIETAKRNILFQSEMQDYIAKIEIPVADLKAEYKRRAIKSASNLVEYKASHILAKTEDQAKNIISLLDKGKSFPQLAKQFSTASSAKNGGELGWFGANQTTPQFSSAIKLLKNGQYTQNPVKSSHGWHVILRENSRPRPVPEFKTVVNALKTRMKRIKLQNYMRNLKKNADVILISATAIAEN